ncbi:MAG TPA: hypothetical protein VH814_16575 [Steroidobacteraceae bacterium]
MRTKIVASATAASVLLMNLAAASQVQSSEEATVTPATVADIAMSAKRPMLTDIAMSAKRPMFV